jgi:hypothetical protein
MLALEGGLCLSNCGKAKSNLGNGDRHFLRCASDVMELILFYGI